MHHKFDPTGIQTHGLQIMTVYFMSLSLCSNHLAISDPCKIQNVKQAHNGIHTALIMVYAKHILLTSKQVKNL